MSVRLFFISGLVFVFVFVFNVSSIIQGFPDIIICTESIWFIKFCHFGKHPTSSIQFCPCDQVRSRVAVGGVEEEVVLPAGAEALMLPGAGLSRSPLAARVGPAGWAEGHSVYPHPQWELVMWLQIQLFSDGTKFWYEQKVPQKWYARWTDFSFIKRDQFWKVFCESWSRRASYLFFFFSRNLLSFRLPSLII